MIASGNDTPGAIYIMIYEIAHVVDEANPLPHPPRIGWIGTTALAMGGSNQSLFLIAALFAGQEGIPGQGSAAVPLLLLGLLLSYAAVPGWTELVLMSPQPGRRHCRGLYGCFPPLQRRSLDADRCVLLVGLGSDLRRDRYPLGHRDNSMVPALRPGAAARLRARRAVHNAEPVRHQVGHARWLCRSRPLSATLAFISTLAPVLAGTVDWHARSDFHLTTPFDGWFGSLTSLMAGLYLIGFAAPAFEAATCHVAETVDPVRNVPRAMLGQRRMAAIYFVVLPRRLAWRRSGPDPLGGDLGAGPRPHLRAVVRRAWRSPPRWAS